jgi:hypothetical protein
MLTFTYCLAAAASSHFAPHDFRLFPSQRTPNQLLIGILLTAAGVDVTMLSSCDADWVTLS